MESAKKVNPILMLLHQPNLDYDKHCLITLFGAYVQTHYEPDPSSNVHYPCTLDCVCLLYTDNSQGQGYHLLNLCSDCASKGQTVMTVPIGKTVIDLVHE